MNHRSSTKLVASFSLAIFFASFGLIAHAADDVWNSPAPTNQNVLCVYNSTSVISTDICNYYASKRPGAAKLGLKVPDKDNDSKPVFDLDDDYRDKDYLPKGQTTMREAMTDHNFASYVAAPIKDYLSKHPNITHLAVAKDLPIRVNNRQSSDIKSVSAGVFLSFETSLDTTVMDVTKSVANYSDSRADGCVTVDAHFDPKKCKVSAGSLPLRLAVSFLNAYSLKDVTTMIDKAQAPAPVLSQSKWLIDLKAENNNPYDQIYNNAVLLRSDLMSLGIDQQNVSIDFSDVATLRSTDPVVAYGGWGSHHPGYTREWATQNVKVPLTNRAIIDAYESYFGYSANLSKKPILVTGTQQGVVADGLTANAFGGSSYSSSASGGVGTVQEPWLGAVIRFEYMFSEYAAGKTFAESFMSSMLEGPSVMGIAYGDPLMTITDTNTLVPPKNQAPTIDLNLSAANSNGAVAVVMPNDGTPAKLQLSAKVSDDNLPYGRGIGHRVSAVWTQKSGVTRAVIPTPTVTEDNSYTTTVTFPQTGRYVIGLTAADGTLDEGGLVTTKDVTIDVKEGNSTRPPVNKAPVIKEGKVVVSTTNVQFPIVARANLGLVATDDGFPNGLLHENWTKVSGPGNVTFIPAVTGVTSERGLFDMNGTYVLRLVADDGELSTTKEVTIEVKSGSTVPGGTPSTNNPTTPNLPSNQTTPTTPTKRDDNPKSDVRTTRSNDSLPQVTITSPQAASTVSGTNVKISAETGFSGLTGRIAAVQFRIDGSKNIGSEQFTRPFDVVWDSTKVSNGTHTLTAVVRDTAGHSAISTGVPVIVSNDPKPNTTPTTPTVGVPNLSSVNPTHGLAGSVVQISGDNFTSNNAVSIVASSGASPIGQPTWTYSIASNPSAQGSATLSYTIPGVNAGTYLLKVLNVGGSSNYLAFTVDAPADLMPKISSPLTISCTVSVPCGNQSIIGTNFLNAGNDVKIDGVVSATLPAYVNGTQIVFTIPTSITEGNHTLTVSNVNGTSNSINLAVAAQTSLPTITSISPTSGPIGTTVTLTGSHFTTNTDNNIQFIKSPYLINITARSSDGTHLSFPLNYNYVVPDSTVLKIFVDNDQYGFSDDNPSYAANPVTFTVTATNNPPQNNNQPPNNVAAPTATFTIEGQSSYTYTVGQTNHYVWSSTNADTFSSSYTSTGPAACGSGPWVANSASGSSSSVLTSNYAGCVWTVTYTAKNSTSGQSASATVTVTVQPASNNTPQNQSQLNNASAVTQAVQGIQAITQLLKTLYSF